MSTPIPLPSARELAEVMPAEHARAIEDWCERNRQWIERGAEAALVRTCDVRALLAATPALAAKARP